MMDQNFLRDRVRKTVQAGELPNRLPDRLFGGMPTGDRCAFCKESTHGEMEVELVFNANGHPGQTTYYAHPRCFSLFVAEIEVLSARTLSQANEAANAD
jgi:hypothetical protein